MVALDVLSYSYINKRRKRMKSLKLNDLVFVDGYKSKVTKINKGPWSKEEDEKLKKLYRLTKKNIANMV